MLPDLDLAVQNADILEFLVSDLLLVRFSNRENCDSILVNSMWFGSDK